MSADAYPPLRAMTRTLRVVILGVLLLTLPSAIAAAILLGGK